MSVGDRATEAAWSRSDSRGGEFVARGGGREAEGGEDTVAPGAKCGASGCHALTANLER